MQSFSYRDGFFIAYRFPTHLWQGFALPTEQKQKPSKASENSLKMCRICAKWKNSEKQLAHGVG